MVLTLAAGVWGRRFDAPVIAGNAVQASAIRRSDAAAILKVMRELLIHINGRH